MPESGADDQELPGDRNYQWELTAGQQAVYRKALEVMPASTARVVEIADWTVPEIDWLVCHQANKRIVDALAVRLGILPSQCLVNIDQAGNTAAASHPGSALAGNRIGG